MPLYIGISLHYDDRLMVKLREMFKYAMDRLTENHKSSNIEIMVNAIQEIWIQGKKEHSGWRKPDDYHVTTYFLGKDAEKLEHELFTSFTEKVEIPVEIYALVIVPGKLITGICFPDHPVGNRCPHVTLMTNEWKPVMSNALLEESCTRGTRSPFAEPYEELRHSRKVKESHQVLNGQVKVDRNGPTSSCYFIALEEPVTFRGLTKIYY